MVVGVRVAQPGLLLLAPVSGFSYSVGIGARPIKVVLTYFDESVEGRPWPVSDTVDQAMFDRVDHPARGRRGGRSGAPTTIAQSDGTPMNGKGKQFVPHGQIVEMAFPGGGGYGDATDRPVYAVKRDLLRGYISAQSAAQDYGLGDDEIAAIQELIAKGEDI